MRRRPDPIRDSTRLTQSIKVASMLARIANEAMRDLRFTFTAMGMPMAGRAIVLREISRLAFQEAESVEKSITGSGHP